MQGIVLGLYPGVHLKQLLGPGQVETKAVAWLGRVLLELAEKVVEVQ
jgi:hypothetical protein